MSPTVRTQVVNRISRFSDQDVPESYRDHRALIDAAADDVLAIVAHALTSDAVVEKAGDAIRRNFHGDTYEGDARAAITAALLAAGIVKGEK